MTKSVGMVVLGLVSLMCTCGPSSKSGSAPPVASTAGTAVGLPEKDARHLLQRAAFGPAPGDVERVAAMGLEAWLDEQSNPTGPDPALEKAIQPYTDVLGTPDELVQLFDKGKGDAEDLDDGTEAEAKAHVDKASLLRALNILELARHISSRYQLREVMADFWANHFNVHGTKANVALTAPAYLEGIRLRALGRFVDLLRYTAQHPAMLVYLDNVSSVALPEGKKGTARDEFRGLNENYARELLELHTLGVDGGYTQEDVREAARVLTGWGVEMLEDSRMVFEFDARKHDQGAKRVLGQQYAAGGQKEGEDLLLFLSRHPSTARFLAGKLCRRFVADEPPVSCVSAVSEAYTASDGDIAQTLRALFRSEAFWDASVRQQKFKSPLEFLVSAARALDARLDGTNKLARRLDNLGEGLFRYPAPTGYPEPMGEWLTGGALLSRFEIANELARGGAIGLVTELTGASESTEEVLDAAEKRVLGERAGDTTRQAIVRELEGLKKPAQKQLVALALLLGSPEFQRQ